MSLAVDSRNEYPVNSCQPRVPPERPDSFDPGGSMAKRARKTYTEARRTEILAAAQKENLTANDVKKKFGVTPVTYYSWRKKEGVGGRRVLQPSQIKQSVSSGSQIVSVVPQGVYATVTTLITCMVR